MNGITIRKADRSKRKARVGLLGPTGSGKTLSGLLIANGFGGRACLIDTENNSADLYSDHKLLDGFEYDVISLQKPYSVERYIEAMTMIEKAGYATMIIDSLSHAWAGPGGILEFVDKRTNTDNKFAAWRQATPKHNELVDRLVHSPCHLIITMRVKMEYVMEKDDKGSTVVRKVGLQPVQRDGLEYEFDLVFDIDNKTHMATSTKDRTSLFDGTIDKIIPDTGTTLMAWLNKGKELPAEATTVEPAPASTQQPAVEPKGALLAKLEDEVTDFELGFIDAATLPDLAAHFDKGQKHVRGYVKDLGAELVKPFIDRLIAAKDKRKAAIAQPHAAPAIARTILWNEKSEMVGEFVTAAKTGDELTGKDGKTWIVAALAQKTADGETWYAKLKEPAPAGDLIERVDPNKLSIEDVKRLASFAVNEGLTDLETLAELGVQDLAELPLASYAEATDRIMKAARAKKKLEKPARAKRERAAA